MDCWIRLSDIDGASPAEPNAAAHEVFVARRPKPGRFASVEILTDPTEGAHPSTARVMRPGTGAVFFIGFVYRKPGMTLDDFQSYWAGDHARLGLQLPHVVRYVQHHLADGGPVDGIVELGFDDEADARAALSSDLMLGDIQRDEEHFIDRTRAWGFIADRRTPTRGTT